MAIREWDPAIGLIPAVAAASAAAIAVAAWRFLPGVFWPWPVSFLIFLVAGSIGAAAAWSMPAARNVFPAAVLLLPLIRLFLLVLKHGPPPWRIPGGAWIAGDGFLWWAGAALLCSGYSGFMARRFGRLHKSLAAIRQDIIRDDPFGLLIAEQDGQAVRRLYQGTVLAYAALFTLAGPAGECFPSLIAGGCFLVLGLYLAGRARALAQAADWLATGTEIAPFTIRQWWRGYSTLLWPLILLLPILPGGFRPLDPAMLLERFLNISLSHPPPARAGSQPFTGANQGALAHGGVISVIVQALYLLMTVLMCAVALCTVLAAIAFVLGRLGVKFGGWLRSFGPVWRGIQKFAAAFWRVLRGAMAAGGGFMRRSRAKLVSAGGKSRRPGRNWPASPNRRLFARLILWGRQKGADLRSTFSPSEWRARLAPLVPGAEEDLDLLVELYRRERYGERMPDSRDRALFRQAWRRVIRDGGPGGKAHPAGEENRG